MKQQLERIFFNRDLTSQDLEKFSRLVNPDDPISPFNKFVGNRKAIKKLSVVAYNALQRDNHLCNDIYFSLVGPPSAGKTTLVKLFAKTLKLPLIEISPRSIKNIDDFFHKVYVSLRDQEVPLVEIERSTYELPACIIFIDEVHALKNNIVQGLLKATEKHDAILHTESGYKINCRKACWIIATTDIGKVFDAFKSRFSNIELQYLTKKEISQVFISICWRLLAFKNSMDISEEDISNRRNGTYFVLNMQGYVEVILPILTFETVLRNNWIG